MKKLLFILCLLISSVAYGQGTNATAYRFHSGAALPATCLNNISVVDIFYLKSGVAANDGLYTCSANLTSWDKGGLAVAPLQSSRTISTTSPITGGGDLSADRAIACATCGVTGTGLNQFASTTSAQLAGVLSDETGTGAAVFGTSPTIVTPTIASFTNATHNHQNAAGGGSLDGAAIGSGTIASARGGFGADVSASSGVPLFASGTATFTSTSGTGNFARVTSPAFTTPNIGAATTASQITSTLATGTAPFAITSTTPVANLAASPTTYNAAGTQQTGTHLVIDTATLSAGTVTVTFAGSAVFSSNTSFTCGMADASAAAAVGISRVSGSQITITGTGTHVILYVCVGN